MSCCARIRFQRCLVRVARPRAAFCQRVALFEYEEA